MPQWGQSASTKHSSAEVWQANVTSPVPLQPLSAAAMTAVAHKNPAPHSASWWQSALTHCPNELTTPSYWETHEQSWPGLQSASLRHTGLQVQYAGMGAAVQRPLGVAVLQSASEWHPGSVHDPGGGSVRVSTQAT